MRHFIWSALAALTVGTAAAHAQATVPPSPGAKSSSPANAGTAARATTTAPVAPAQTQNVQPPGSLAGVLSLPNGRRAAGASVEIVSEGASTPLRRKLLADTAGNYRVDSLPAGSYLVSFSYPGARSVQSRMPIQGSVWRDEQMQLAAPEQSPPVGEILWTLAALAAYYATILLARWHNIARTTRQLLHHRLEVLGARVAAAAAEPADGNGAALQKLKENVDHLRDDELGESRGWKLLPELFFWSRGFENAAWIEVHNIERQLLEVHSSDAEVEASLRSYITELRAINKPSANGIAAAIDTEFSRKDSAAAGLPDPTPYRRALLGRALTVIYNERDNAYTMLLEWQNKAGWLNAAALLIILFLTIAVGNPVLFLAGAAGGLLSRLARALKRDDMPVDYGASWTTFFLSPILGAIIAWFGVALVTVLAAEPVNLLGPAFKVVDWAHPRAPMTLAIAFVLGFSERLFDSVVAALEGSAKATADRARSAPVSPTPSAAALVQPTPDKQKEKVGRKTADHSTISLTDDDVKRIEEGKSVTLTVTSP